MRPSAVFGGAIAVAQEDLRMRVGSDFYLGLGQFGEELRVSDKTWLRRNENCVVIKGFLGEWSFQRCVSDKLWIIKLSFTTKPRAQSNAAIPTEPIHQAIRLGRFSSELHPPLIATNSKNAKRTLVCFMTARAEQRTSSHNKYGPFTSWEQTQKYRCILKQPRVMLSSRSNTMQL